MAFSYPFWRRLGLGAHLAVIIALAAVPTSLLIIQFIDSERREAIEDAEDWARSSAQTGAQHHRAAIDAARSVLEAAARQIDAGNATPCASASGRSNTIWFLPPYGEPTCSSEPGFPLPEAVVDTVYEDAENGGFAVVGPYLVAPKQLSVFAVLTVVGPDSGRLHIIRPIDLEWIPNAYDDLDPNDLVVMALDGDGEIFMRSSLVGDGAVTADNYLELAMPMQAVMDGDTSTVEDVDGRRRIFGSAALPEPGITVLVGVSHDAVMSKALKELIGSLALFGAVLTLSGVLAWLVIERKILRSVRVLRDAAVATARGEATPRVDIADGPIELRELADAFNDMTDKLEFQAFHDQLTGLGNRRYIEKKMADLLSEGEPFAVLAVDLDGFKPINDTYGHAVGDFVLAEAAQRLRDGLGDGLFIGRTGGDEFLAATRIEGLNPADAASFAARNMLDHLTLPIRLRDGTEVTIGGCVGIAFWRGEDGNTVYDVVREADAALYRAKETGRNRYVGPGLSGRPTRAA